MSLSWLQRKEKLAALLKSDGDEDADGLALDRLLHGQNVIGKTHKTVEIDTLRFQDRDLNIVGTLEYGQFGVIDVVTCRLDGLTYVRKSTEKRFALRTRDQCFPQFERDILLQALKTDSRWAPHLLCAFQTPSHLNLVMTYGEGGSLWDVLESSVHSGKLLELDLEWWIPQIVSAIHWCHSQGFAHRDIKPQNFVVKQDAHLLLIDFGSAAPLLPPRPDGSQFLPKKYCLLPCGTCDYISPEILQAHEAALVALEMDDDEELRSLRSSKDDDDESGYGVETDWWSFGAMLYEMAYGYAPFFASEIRQTYQKIMNHERSLRFDDSIPVPSVYTDFIRKLLTRPERRIGRRNIMEITSHPLFEAVNWTNLHEQQAPESLHLPQFAYNEQPIVQTESLTKSQYEESLSKGFAFSALFQSSSLAGSSGTPSGVGGLSSILRQQTLSTPVKSAMAVQEDPSAAFIGFSWGPTRDAFPTPPSSTPDTLSPPSNNNQLKIPSTPQITPIGTFSHFSTPLPPSTAKTTHLLATPQLQQPRYNSFSTPVNRLSSFTPFRTNTLPRSVPRTAQRRELSDREAMKQLVDCVGMSARKRVLESGRKPRFLTNTASVRSRSGYGTGKELRFVGERIPALDFSLGSMTANGSASASLSSSTNNLERSQVGPTPAGANAKGNESNPLDDVSNFPTSHPTLNLSFTTYANTAATANITDSPRPPSEISTEIDTELTESEGPPSPSPRPNSALSTSMLSRRSSGSVTPTATMTFSMLSSSLLMMRNGSSSSLVKNTNGPSEPLTKGGSGSESALLGRTSSGSGTGSGGLLAVPTIARSASFPSVLLPQPTVEGGRQEGEHRMRVEGEKVRRRDGDEDMRVKGRSDRRQLRPRGSTITGTSVEGVKRKETRERVSDLPTTVKKRRNSDAGTRTSASSDAPKRVDNSRIPDRVKTTHLHTHAHGRTVASHNEVAPTPYHDDYGRLEKRLGQLMGDINDIQGRLARVKLMLRSP